MNETGSIPDETNKDAMCYMKCYLENIGILQANSQVNKDLAIDMAWATSEETIDQCVNEMS